MCSSRPGNIAIRCGAQSAPRSSTTPKRRFTRRCSPPPASRSEQRNPGRSPRRDHGQRQPQRDRREPAVPPRKRHRRAPDRRRPGRRSDCGRRCGVRDGQVFVRRAANSNGRAKCPGRNHSRLISTSRLLASYLLSSLSRRAACWDAIAPGAFSAETHGEDRVGRREGVIDLFLECVVVADILAVLGDQRRLLGGSGLFTGSPGVREAPANPGPERIPILRSSQRPDRRANRAARRKTNPKLCEAFHHCHRIIVLNCRAAAATAATAIQVSPRTPRRGLMPLVR